MTVNPANAPPRRRIDDKSRGDDGLTGDREFGTHLLLFVHAAARPIRSTFDMAAAAAAGQAHDETDYPTARARAQQMSLNLSLFSPIRPTEHCILYYTRVVKSSLAPNEAFVRAHLFGRKERCCCSSSIVSIENWDGAPKRPGCLI